MQSLESGALEPTKADLKGLSFGARLVRFLPVYGLVILTVFLIGLFSILLPNTFPTMLNLRAIVSDKGGARRRGRRAQGPAGWTVGQDARDPRRGPRYDHQPPADSAGRTPGCCDATPKSAFGRRFPSPGR